ncbi:MAG TPA: hypothetical protein ENO22_04460 [candidate division Zixibacteria bacterium]|nr:hypothetical protein [candidate division Zixibacteria bacterium]HEQ98578.1 hypothetical protein [candidate division Zixibacteria bacterium]
MTLAGVKTDLPVWFIKGEVRGETYRNLMRYICRHCKYFSMVTRDAITLEENARKFMSTISPHLKETREKQYEWPGTRISREYEQLLGKDWFEVQGATLRIYDCSNEALEYILRVTDSLFQFVHPDYPEDFTCYRDVDDPFLVTVSHEEIGAIIAGDKERKQIEQIVPGLKLVEEKGFREEPNDN